MLASDATKIYQLEMRRIIEALKRNIVSIIKIIKFKLILTYI